MTGYLVAFLLGIPLLLFGQTGSIRGQVTDARTGEPLVGANIIIVGSKPGHGAATDMNGMFLIHKIPPGEYVLRATYIDYQTFTIQNVNVIAGQATETNIALRREGDPEPVIDKAVDTLVVQKDTTKQPPAGGEKQ